MARHSRGACARISAAPTPHGPSRPRLARRNRPHTRARLAPPVSASSSGEDGESFSQSDANDVVPDVSGVDWRSFRARLVSGEAEAATGPSAGLWAHPLGNRPERGMLLIARPYAFQASQTYFQEAVILIIDYSPERGAVGLILNRPTQYALGGLSKDISSAARDGGASVEGDGTDGGEGRRGFVDVPDEFKENRVYFAGDVRPSTSDVSTTLVCLHPYGQREDEEGANADDFGVAAPEASARSVGQPDGDSFVLQGSREIVDKVFINGAWYGEEVRKALRDGRAKPEHFKVRTVFVEER